MTRWISVPYDEAHAHRLAHEIGLPRPASIVLAGRGLHTPDRVHAWLRPRLSLLSDPFELPDMAAATDRLLRAVERKERVLVYGDYDVDGITSTALLTSVLRTLGATAIPFLPHRVDDGYGLSVEPVQRCLEVDHPDCIVTVDCGTHSVEAVEWAQRKGVDVIITDHHEPGGATLAPARAVVNPKRSGTPPHLHGLAGVGVAFKLCHALLKRLRTADSEMAHTLDLRAHLDWVALGTIADMVPLTEENRTLAFYGLRALSTTPKPGLQALKKIAGLHADIDGYHVGFQLGPRLNAAGRLGTAQAALELLLTDDPERAHDIALELDAANHERQRVEAEMLEQAEERIAAECDLHRDWGLVVARAGWHPGVMGIVASRLSKRYTRPVVVIALDEEGLGRGSCRSISAFNMVEGLTACDPHLQQYGGHAMAAGLQIKADAVASFREAFNRTVREHIKADDLQEEVRIDAWMSLREADWPLIETIEQMAPFGIGNPKPVWAIQGAQIIGQPRILKDKHLKFSVLGDNVQLDAIAFNLAHRPLPCGPIDLAFQLSRNRYMNRETLQMIVQDFRPATANEGSPDAVPR